MKTHLSTLLIVGALVGAVPLLAQRERPARHRGRLSPHATISSVIDGNRITIVYGRPHTKSPFNSEMRTIWGGLVPYGKVWRMGADEATLLITQKPIDLGGATVPAGAYTLFMLPEAEGASKLIINKQIGQWGLQYNPAEDLARIDLKKGTLDRPVHQFTMAIARNPSGGGVLELRWEDTQFTAPITVQK